MRIDRCGQGLSVRRQCGLLSVCRASVYYKAVPMSEANAEFMDKIDRQYLETPYYGRPKLTVHLRKMGYVINPKRVRRLMGLLQIRAIRPKFNTSKPHPRHPVYPYLLRGLAIVRPNQVFAADITFIRLKRGFMYLVAVIDVFSRRVMSWKLSNTLDSGFCVETAKDAFMQATPEIFNTDQGSQFTSYDFTGALKNEGIRISMDGKGRAIDNVFIERLWRSVKYECTLLRQFETVSELRQELTEYFEFYNTRRYHQALNYKTPEEVYFGENNAGKIQKKSPKMMDLKSCGNVENPPGLHTVPQPLLRR